MINKIDTKLSLIIACILLIINPVFSQDDLEKILENQTKEEVDYTTATFKNTHVLNGHSIELMKKGELEFRISHRFGELNSGAYNFWGLDQANIHLGFEYGITDMLNIGIGRGTYQKSYDGFIKYKILRQSTGGKKMPISLVYFTSVAINSLNEKDLNDYFSHRVAYCHQVLIARKFDNDFSMQLSPTYIHRNYVETAVDLNDLFSIGISGRYKLTHRITFNAEYFYTITPTYNNIDNNIINPLSIGFDIETGGHVFQVHLTNSLAMIEKGFIGETTGKWKDKGIHFGFNLSRTF